MVAMIPSNGLILPIINILFSLRVVLTELYTNVPYTYDNQVFDTYHFFKDEKAILSYFKEEKEKNSTQADELLKAYSTCFDGEDVPLPSGKRSPFIVIEGGYFQNGQRLSKIVANMMNGEFVNYIPDCLVHLNPNYRDERLQKHAFYLLSLYAAAFKVKQLLAKGKTVVMNGYWSEKVANLMGRMYRKVIDLPPVGSEIYNHPEDLLKPDLLIFLKYQPYNVNMYYPTSYPERFAKKLKIYSNFVNPLVTTIHTSKHVYSNLKYIMNKIIFQLGSKYTMTMGTYSDKPHHDRVKRKNVWFPNEKSVLKYFEFIKKSDIIKVEKILNSYNNCFTDADVSPSAGRRKPFVVVEGNNLQNRDRIVYLLADHMGAKILNFPPKCMYRLRKTFPIGSLKKHALFSLFLYASAFEVRKYQKKGIPIVMNRYWTEHAEMNIAKMHRTLTELPPSYNIVYKHPEDLTEPDMVIFLRFPVTDEKLLNATKYTGYMAKTLQIYKYFKNPPVTIINASEDLNVTLASVTKQLEMLLGDKCDLSRSNYTMNKEKYIDKYYYALNPKYVFFKDEKSILRFLKNQTGPDQKIANEIMAAYNSTLVEGDFHKLSNKSVPLIVIEGNYFQYREKMCKILAANIGARYVSLLPQSMYVLRSLVSDNNRLKNAYYSLCLYGFENHIKQCLLAGIPVVTNRYWTEFAEKNIARMYKNVDDLPPSDDEMYTQPKDLIMPDLLVYFKCSSMTELAKSITIYKRFKNPSATIVDSKKGFNSAMKNIHQHLESLFGEKYSWSNGQKVMVDENHYLDFKNDSLQYTLFKNERSILNLLEKERKKFPEVVEQILMAYSRCHYEKDVQLPHGKRRPFIVIGGNNYQYKSKQAEMLANKMGGVFLRYPPRCMSEVRDSLPKRYPLKQAFFSLAFYVSAFNVRRFISRGIPVITNNYWSEHAMIHLRNTYSIAEDLPPPDDGVYKQPTDLTIPDLYFYLKFPSTEANTPNVTITSKMAKTNQVMQNINNPRFTIIEYSHDINSTFTEVYKKVETLLGNTYDLTLSNYVQVKKDILDHFYEKLDGKYDFLKDEKSILAFFEKRRETNPTVIEEFLKAYNNCFIAHENPLPYDKRKPFIVIEGDDYSKRERICISLAVTLDACIYRFPPTCVYNLRKMFSAGSLLKTAFYSISLYAAAFEIKQILARGSTVILNGYWSEQAALIITKKRPKQLRVNEPKNLYSPPKNLLMPDMLVYLQHTTSDRKLYINRYYQESSEKVQYIYKQFECPKVDIINSLRDDDEVLDDIIQRMKESLGHKFDFIQNISVNVPPTFSDTIEYNLSTKHILFKDEISALSVFKNEQKNQPRITQSVLNDYNDCFYASDTSVSRVKRKPFIVIEGNDYANRELLSIKLSEAMDAEVVRVPPQCLYKFRKIFQEGSVLRQAFMTLSFYSIAFQIRQILARGKAVVVNGYWTEHAESTIRQMHNETIPEPNDAVYESPLGLSMPDIVVYLKYVPKGEENTSLSATQLAKSVAIYKRFKSLRVAVINSNRNIKSVFEDIEKKVKTLLGKDYDLHTYFNFINKASCNFRDEKSLLELFQIEREKYPEAVDKVLASYKECMRGADVPLKRNRKVSFIVIEGNNYKNKQIMAIALAEHLNAKYLSFPPHCLYELRNIFVKGSLLKHAFFSLALYATAFHVRNYMEVGLPVVVDGYWYQQMEHIIRVTYKAQDQLPPPGSDIYSPPEDLFMPDVIIYLNYTITDKMFLDRTTAGASNLTLEIYKKFNCPPVTIIESSGGVNVTVFKMIEKMQSSFVDEYKFDRTRKSLSKYPILYRDKQMLLSYIENAGKDQENEVQKLMKAYNECVGLYSSNINLSPGRRKPFIVIEGNNVYYKKKIAKKLAISMKAKCIDTVPTCLYRLTSLFGKGNPLRNAFFSLCLYATSVMAKQFIATGIPVVKNGYWFEKASYVIGLKYKGKPRLPTEGRNMYDIPDDLLKPDMLIYLNYGPTRKRSFHIDSQLITEDRAIEIYKNFNYPPVTIINASINPEHTLTQIKEKMHSLLSDKFDLGNVLPAVVIPGVEKKRTTFKDKKMVLTVLENLKKTRPKEVNEIMKAYNSCVYNQEVRTFVRKKPFIVLEGSDYHTRGIVSTVLATRLNAQFINTIPDCMFYLRKAFSKGGALKQAFFALSLYATSFSVKMFLTNGIPVVKNGYWFEQMAYTLFNENLKRGKLPSVESGDYDSPKGLIQPDILIYLNSPLTSDDYVPTPRNMDTVTLQIYNTFNITHFHIVNTSGLTTDDLVTQIHKHIFILFKDKYDGIARGFRYL